MIREPSATSPSETDVAASADAVAGLAIVEARVAQCAPEERAAFWEAVGRCFGGGKPPAPGEPETDPAGPTTARPAARG